MGAAAPLGRAGPSSSFSLKVNILVTKTTTMVLFSAIIMFHLLTLLNFPSINKEKLGILVRFLIRGLLRHRFCTFGRQL